MEIKVIDNLNNEEIFRGKAKEFLIINDNEEELADCIAKLMTKEMVTYVTFLGQSYNIYKI